MMKGPVCRHRMRPLRFQRVIRLVNKISFDREVMYPYGGVGGLHQVVSEMILSLFVDNRQRRKEKN
jgi:hypothetical protein